MIHAVIILILNYIIFHNDLPDSLHNIGRESIEDDERSGKPSTSKTDENIVNV